MRADAKSFLILNPGSTSTKFALYSNSRAVCSVSLPHTQEELSGFSSIAAQKVYRRNLIEKVLRERNLDCNLDLVIGIGGLIRPDRAGVFEVTPAMIEDLEEARYDEHAANLAALIGFDMARDLGIKAYVADAITADELADIGRISGIPEIVRKGRCHTLNQKYMGRKAAEELGVPYTEAHLIVAHLGGGISIASHRDGRIIETNAARGEGPFCIDRSGGVNSFELAKLCLSGKYSRSEMLRKINGSGGVVAYLGTRDFREVENRVAAGDDMAKRVFDSMAYQIAKEIAAQTIALSGRIDAIVLTGGMANSRLLTDRISSHVSFLSRILIYPGEGEMQALADYAVSILDGSLEPVRYERNE